MVNELQLLKALESTMKYYERKLSCTEDDYEQLRLIRKLSELDVEIYDLECGDD